MPLSGGPKVCERYIVEKGRLKVRRTRDRGAVRFSEKATAVERAKVVLSLQTPVTRESRRG